MNKKVLVLLITLVVLSLVIIPASAGPPQEASGTWWYYPTLVDEKPAGCNLFHTTRELGVWSGTFQGNSTEKGKVVIHCTGTLSFKAIVTFEEVTVDGKTGGLEMSVVGQYPADATEWYGSWVITSGTGELKNLRGQGNWWGPGADGTGVWGYVDYEGNYHFEP